MRRPIRERSRPVFVRRSGKKFRPQFRLVRRYPRGKAVRFYSSRNRFVIERLSRGSAEPNQKSGWRALRQELVGGLRRPLLEVGVMNCVEYGPEDIALELESAHGFSLKLECVAIFHCNRERLVRIAPRLRDSAAEILQPARIKPLIEFFEGCKPVHHQIWSKKFGQRRRDGDRPRLTAREVHVRIHGKAYSGQQMSIIQ